MTGRLERTRSVLVLVDFQHRLMPAIAAAASVLDRAVLLARVAGLLGVPVLATEQTPAKLGPTVPELADLCERTLAKEEFSAAAVLVPALADLAGTAGEGRPQLVLAGCEAHVCLLQTALALDELGLPVVVVADACGSRHPDDRALALRRLEAHGIPLVSAEMVAFEWLGTSADPAFREISALVKPRDGVARGPA